MREVPIVGVMLCYLLYAGDKPSRATLNVSIWRIIQKHNRYLGN